MNRLLWISVAIFGLAATSANARLVPKQKVLADFGACIVKYSPERADRLLRTPIRSAAESELLDELIDANSSCLKGRWGLTMYSGAIRGSIAEAMLRNRPEYLNASRNAPLAQPMRPMKTEGRTFVASYAACLARADQPAAVRLIETEYRSFAEREAFLAFGKTLQDCMPLDITYKVDITDVRNHTADALYSLNANAAVHSDAARRNSDA